MNLFLICYLIIFTTMSNLSHPLSLLKNEWVTMIRSESAQAEKQGKLTKKQLALIYEQEWFKALVPATYGGKQMALPALLELQEALACADGSLGWVVTLCSGAGWFGGFIEKNIATELFADPKVCLAGSGMPAGSAEETSTGYTITGKWKYASGSSDATIFTANCIITSNGKPVLNNDGEKIIRSFFFYRNEVTVSNTWNAMGMVATATNSFVVKDLKVDNSRTFDIGRNQQVNAALYHYPFQQLAEATLAINLSGMCFYFLDLCEQVFEDTTRDGADAFVARPALRDTLEAYRQKLEHARQKLYYAADMSWQICAVNKEISASVLYKVTAASFTLAKVVREASYTLYQYCGLDATNKDSDLNRVFRNIHTAGQHNLLIGDGSI